jgi:MerR family mercuric resistance operon transcriptional regulator
MAPHMRIGSLAKKTGVHVETIRYYQKIGLMPKPGPGRGLVRRYGRDAVERLQFIKRAQRFGFSLDEVKALLELSGSGQCSAVQALARQKLDALQSKLERLREMHTALNRLVDACGGCGSGQGCPIIVALSADEPQGGLTEGLCGREEHLFIPAVLDR